MFRRHPPDVRPGGTCVVVRDLRGLTELADSGEPPAHVVYCDAARVPRRLARRLRTRGGSLSRPTVLETEPDFRVRNLYEPSQPDESDVVRLTLERLHAEHHFARIEFPAGGGLGFRATQAKRAGLAFADVPLVVRLDTCGAWRRDQEQRWPAGYAEVEADFLERFAFEHADERVTPDLHLLNFVRRLGWVEHEDTPAPPPPVGEPGLVTVGIAHYNLGRYLPETLASLAAQTYPHVEVIVIDDGSTDPDSAAVFDAMTARYSRYRFLRQPNAGIGATRNRCLELARGEFFLPVDADNLARPEMIERFVAAIRRNPGLAAMSCYFVAFEVRDTNPPHRYCPFALRPTGGPHALAGIRNVYGDASAIFRTEALRAVNGYETDRGTSCEDWEAFVKMVHAGRRLGVVPAHLFDYRHLPDGFSRRTNWYANHQRVLRQFHDSATLPPGEQRALRDMLVGFHLRLEQLAEPPPRRSLVTLARTILARFRAGGRR